jgi:AcrR family transcriptional regulator
MGSAVPFAIEGAVLISTIAHCNTASKSKEIMSTTGTARKSKPVQESDLSEIQSLRSQLKRLTKERLISSAVELFAKNGFRATSVGDIAKAAGTTPTTFYRYFSSKSDIARLLQDHINVDVKSTFERLDEIKRPTKHAVRGWLDQYDQMWQRNHVLCDAFWEATSTDPELAAELVPVTYRLTESMKMVQSLADGDNKTKFQTRLVLMYLLMDRLLYLVNIQQRNANGLRMLDEFSEILRAALFSNDK